MGYYFTSMLKYWRKLRGVFKVASGEDVPEWPEITTDELFDRFESNPPGLLLDVRSKGDYGGGYGHLPNAVSIPMLELESRLGEIMEHKDEEVVTMCPGGGLSLVAIDVLRDAGFKDVKSLKGGTDEWSRNGYPTTMD